MIRLLALATGASVLAACAQPQGSDDDSTAASQSPSTSSAALRPTASGLISMRELENAIRRIQNDTDTEMSVALYNGDTLTTAGSLGTLPSWSTVKVPIAFAALEHCSYSEKYLEQLITASIEWSDNASAHTLYSCLWQEGTPMELTADAIAPSGTRPAVDPAWGITKWSAPSQAQYGYYLSTIDQDNVVIEAMKNIAEDQSYGLGVIKNSAFKGGWSDHTDGSWHTRQFGFFTHNGSAYGVAIVARSENGSYADGQAALTAIAEVLIDD